jgi:mannose-6-phosphate isomerase
MALPAVAAYPFVLEPQLREMIWGGHALVQRFNKVGDPQATIGESWECYDTSVVANGALRGRTVAQLRETLGTALTGSADPGVLFPLLTKLIDARAALSVQVHPPDAYAQSHEHEPFGKTECWHILEADPGASIVLGWNRDTTRAEYLARVKDGSLDELLRHVPVKAGDTFYLPAGTMHAIGAGIVLFEVQQASDLTYRIFDYNRTGPDGKPRQLHVDKAADVLNYRASHAGRVTSLRYELDGLQRTTYVADARFTLERIALDAQPHGLDLEGQPLVAFALGGPVELAVHGERVTLAPFASALIPASADVVMLRAPDETRPAALLTAAPPKDAYALERRFNRAAVGVRESTDFFAQF